MSARKYIRIPVYSSPTGRGVYAKKSAIVVGHAVVDRDMGHLASRMWWRQRDSRGYPRSTVGKVMTYMHHAVIGKVAGMDVSHLNGDALDNRRSNLRHVRHAENSMNMNDGPFASNKSCGLRGVTRVARAGGRWRWIGAIVFNGKRMTTAPWDTPIDAQKALLQLRASLGIRVDGRLSEQNQVSEFRDAVRKFVEAGK